MHCLSVLLFADEGLRGALGAVLRAVRPSHLLLHRLLVGRLDFTSFYKLGNLLSLNLAERELLAILGLSVGVAHVVALWAVGIARASLVPTARNDNFQSMKKSTLFSDSSKLLAICIF